MSHLKLSTAVVGAAILGAVGVGFSIAGKGGADPVQLSGSSVGHQAADGQLSGNLVTIDNFTFAPQSLEVPAGTTVTWINRDDIPHTIKGVATPIKSQALDTDDSYSFTFSQPGEYSYFCGIHPHMTGKIVVK